MRSRCDRTYGTYVIFSGKVRTVRVRHFAVRRLHFTDLYTGAKAQQEWLC